jgi:hypothetical protein
MFCNWFAHGTHWEGVSGAIRGATAPIHILQWTSAAAVFWNRRIPVAISREEIVRPVTGIVKDASDEEAGQRLKAGATPWRDRDFATRPMA